MVEPWLRGTLNEYDALRRQVLHALELADEDVRRWCAPLDEEELNMRPFHLPSVAFQLRHIVGSLDRLLTYAEGRELSSAQLRSLEDESNRTDTLTLFAHWERGLASAAARLHVVDPLTYEEPRTVGRQHLPSSVGGLLIHCAEHTQRHTGQAITIAQIIARRTEGSIAP